MKKIILAAVLVCLLGFAGALSFNTDGNSYKKGEIIAIAGSSFPFAEIEINAVHGEKNVFAQEVVGDANGNFGLLYAIPYLVPSGGWNLILSDGNSTASKTINVALGAESARYVITFLSPTAEGQKRASDIKISVRVSDSGTPVKGARVFAWVVDGEGIELLESREGVYSAGYEIPFDSVLGKTSIIAAAEKEIDGQKFGGETALEINVAESAILIEVAEPSIKSIELGSIMQIAVNASYTSGKPVGNAKLTVKIGDNEIELKRISPGKYAGDHATSASDFGEIGIIIDAEDSAGNRGAKATSIIVSGWLMWFIRENIIYISVAIIIMLALLAACYFRIRRALQLGSARNERNKAAAALEKAQRDYFEKRTISRDAYQRTSSKCASIIAELDQKISALEKDGKKNNGKRKR